jgi:hypothetical protein
MSRTAVIHQPDFLSYIGFFQRLLNADTFVILDCVQFVTGTSRSWTNRDKIKTSQGEKWLTVAVQKPSFGTKINEVLLSIEADWRNANLNLLKQNYNKALFFDEIFPYVEKIYACSAAKLIYSIDVLLELFDIKIEKIIASTLAPQGKSNELLVDILKKINADCYLSGVGARDYFDPAPFQKSGIRVIWQEFKHPVYPQLHGEFIPFLSSIDLLFNCGIEKSREILRS